MTVTKSFGGDVGGHGYSVIAIWTRGLVTLVPLVVFLNNAMVVLSLCAIKDMGLGVAIQDDVYGTERGT